MSAWGQDAAPVASKNGSKLPSKVKVHPIVVFTVLDHYTRRNEGADRVIGTLLGTVCEKTGAVEVTNAFAVPHNEKDGEVAVGQAFNKTMFGLLSRVNSTEKIVGWYATGSDEEQINESSGLIHDFYASECADAVHLVVDVSLGEKGVQCFAFASKRLTLSTGLELARSFPRLKCEIAFTETERLCVERMIAGQDEPFSSPTSLATLPSDLDGVALSVDRLEQLVSRVGEYVDEVVTGKRQPTPEAARYIADALQSLPNLDGTSRIEAFNTSMQDVVMVSYLASITKAQLAIAAKIHESF